MTGSLVGLELETGGVLLKYLKTAAETQGALHAQEARYPPHSPPPPEHRHPRQDERFVIMQGSLRFRIGGAVRTLHAGEEVVVGRGIVHSAQNPSDAPAVVLWETRPALRTAEFFAVMDRATRGQGRTRPTLLDAAAILAEYRHEFELASPPALVQRVVFGCLAPFGRGVLRAPP